MKKYSLMWWFKSGRAIARDDIKYNNPKSGRVAKRFAHHIAFKLGYLSI